MSVRKRAYAETMQWLDAEHAIEGLHPPEGLHPMALAEWQAGHEEAIADAREHETAWMRTEDLIVFAVKLILLYAVLGIGAWFGGVASFASFALGAVILWRYWGPHGEKE